MFGLVPRLALVFGLVSVLAMPAGVLANHSWGGYHWARTSNPFTLKLGDNVSRAWDSYLATTSSDWSVSAVLDTTITRGRAKRGCSATVGRVEVCNAAYGDNGWLGVATIWITGLHITQGTAQVNDTYYSTPQYNTPAWRNLVMCQEVGHTLGLGHQDEDFGNPNLGTCMDYSNDPSSNQHPNQHDYDQLMAIYSHLDSTTTVSQATPNGAAAGPSADWGREVSKSRDGHVSVFVRDLGAGKSVVTRVIWAGGAHSLRSATVTPSARAASTASVR